MYSHEIEELLKIRNNLVTLQEYKWIALSPQITHIKYENDEFKIKTSDNYKFTLKIQNKCDIIKSEKDNK